VRRTPAPATLVDRGIEGLLCRDRQRPAEAGVMSISRMITISLPRIISMASDTSLETPARAVAGAAYGTYCFTCPSAKLLSKDEARRIAANIAKLPKLLQRRGACSIDRTSPVGGLMAHRRFPPPWSVEAPVSLSATTTDSSLRMSISRMSRADARRRNCSRGMRREGLR
jgi:hypothetical protein